jgi:GntR family transcriptional repressor for pyruvate dehydrogenase complex
MIESVTLERRKLFELVAEHIEGLIVSGKLKAGDLLPPERGLQQAFGVGRPAVREALITLERLGLIEIGSGMPARVARPSVAALLNNLMPSVRYLLSTEEGSRQLQAVRLLVEVGLVRQAARQADDAFVAALRDAFENNRSQRADIAAFSASDVQFHYVIARFAGEPAILSIHEVISRWLTEQREVALREPGMMDLALDHHARILAAIEARDADAAEAAMRTHLAAVQASYWSHAHDADAAGATSVGAGHAEDRDRPAPDATRPPGADSAAVG